jgi:predicted nucleotidyltransferase
VDTARVVEQLRQRFPLLQARFAVVSLSLFGSVARGEAKDGSDIDVLVAFSGDPTFAGYMGLKEDLESFLGCPVDLVTLSSLKPRIRNRVLAELLHVA